MKSTAPKAHNSTEQYREAEGADHIEEKSVQDVIYLLHGDKHRWFLFLKDSKRKAKPT